MAEQSRDALADPWRGVNLGGWLLLEPGPSYPLFTQHLQPDKSQARCEWDLMKVLEKKLGKKRAADVIRCHRDSHTTKDDFKRVRESGLNAVRVPFGYWIVTEPRPKEPYVGPALKYLDLAVDWAEECGLQIVLDLHGCPGGESPEAPCGRRQRPESRWNWKHWDFASSLNILEFVAKRYASRSCVTGVAVCNEPSGEVPAKALISYYSRAVDRIRKAGMSASSVAVILPIFQRPEGEDSFVQRWTRETQGRHRNVCFDVHCYHCFEHFHGYSFAEQLRATEENQQMLQKHPMVVGEWGLCLGRATWCTCGDMEEDTVISMFAAQQMEAFKQASHGSFFWNWKEAPEEKEWNYQLAKELGLFSRPALTMPQWDGGGEDPLEELLHPSPAEARVHYGDSVYLRVFHGMYVDCEGTKIDCRWSDKGEWQRFSLCEASGGSSASAATRDRRPVCHQDVVRIRAVRNGRFLAVQDDMVTTTRNKSSLDGQFRILLDGATTLHHRGRCYFQNEATKAVLNADGDHDGVFCAFEDYGLWQRVVVEKDKEEPSAALPQLDQKKQPSGRGSRDVPLTQGGARKAAAGTSHGTKRKASVSSGAAKKKPSARSK
eukprot:TRINITY_DN12713_c0_g1_i1.p1 TRINITY_DN12713_c0_g1~~TRINITY_DN12713_c0_g1_i1.p1  ORF type:complete len:604 (-),score=119.71 TRINITY_DN12713_c0_g1_i1:26-1837(-)